MAHFSFFRLSVRSFLFLLIAAPVMLSSVAFAGGFIGLNSKGIEAGHKSIVVAGNHFGEVATGDTIVMEYPTQERFASRVTYVHFTHETTRIHFKYPFPDTRAKGEVHVMIRENWHSKDPMNAFRNRELNQPAETKTIWIPGNHIYHLSYLAPIEIKDQYGNTHIRKVTYTKYFKEFDATRVNLKDTDRQFTVLKLDSSNLGLNGPIFADSGLRRAVKAGAKNFWMEGLPFNNLNIGDDFVISSDGTPGGANAETRTVKSFVVTGNATRIFFKDPLVNDHDGSILAPQ